MTSFAIQTPYDEQQAVELSRHLFRKQVLAKKAIKYKGRDLNFDDAYLTELANAYKEGAFDQVPFQLAGADNSHNSSPENFRGEVKGFEVTPDGLDAIFELNDKGAEIVKDNPKLGVSARIIETHERSDGKAWKHAIEHVLGTLNPVVTGLKPWEAIALSNSSLDVIDLTASIYEGATMPLSKEDREKFDAYMTELASLDPGKLVNDGKSPTGDKPASTTGDELDAELKALLNDALADEGASAGAELSAETRNAIDLANARAEQAATETQRIREELDLANFERERADLISEGVPPAMVNLAMPLLIGKEHVIELSNSTKVDAGEIVRGLLTEAKGIVDFSRETTPAPNSPAADKTGVLLSAWEAQHPALTK